MGKIILIPSGKKKQLSCEVVGGGVEDRDHKGREEASALEGDFLNSDKASSGLSLTRLGLPLPRPPFRSKGGQRGAQHGQGAVGTLGEWKRSGAGALGGTDPCSGCSPQ